MNAECRDRDRAGFEVTNHDKCQDRRVQAGFRNVSIIRLYSDVKYDVHRYKISFSVH